MLLPGPHTPRGGRADTWGHTPLRLREGVQTRGNSERIIDTDSIHAISQLHVFMELMPFLNSINTQEELFLGAFFAWMSVSGDYVFNTNRRLGSGGAGVTPTGALHFGQRASISDATWLAPQLRSPSTTFVISRHF
jgi:hypothetical protein